MKVLIIYDSTFGNTEQVANAVARGLAEHEIVTVLPISRAGEANLRDYDLIVVGGPTHNHGLSDELAAWLDHLPADVLHGKVAVAFDTRYHMPRLFSGSAAHDIAKRLKGLGAEMFLPPESFYVVDRNGPLDTGELGRAERWAALTPAGVEA